MVFGDPALEGFLSAVDQLIANGEGGLFASHHFTEHEADEVLDLEHGLEELVKEISEKGTGVALSRRRSGYCHLIKESPLGKYCYEQVPFGREVVVKRGDVKPRGRGQVTHTRAVYAALGHQRKGCV